MLFIAKEIIQRLHHAKAPYTNTIYICKENVFSYKSQSIELKEVTVTPDVQVSMLRYKKHEEARKHDTSKATQ